MKEKRSFVLRLVEKNMNVKPVKHWSIEGEEAQSGYTIFADRGVQRCSLLKFARWMQFIKRSRTRIHSFDKFARRFANYVYICQIIHVPTSWEPTSGYELSVKPDRVAVPRIAFPMERKEGKVEEKLTIGLVVPLKGSSDTLGVTVFEEGWLEPRKAKQGGREGLKMKVARETAA